jgi:hypothetical protein
MNRTLMALTSGKGTDSGGRPTFSKRRGHQLALTLLALALSLVVACGGDDEEQCFQPPDEVGKSCSGSAGGASWTLTKLSEYLETGTLVCPTTNQTLSCPEDTENASIIIGGNVIVLDCDGVGPACPIS